MINRQHYYRHKGKKMFTIDIGSLESGINVEIKSIRWLVSIDPSFSSDSIVLDETVTDNFSTMTFDLPLTSNDIYYVKYIITYTDDTTSTSKPMVVTKDTRGFITNNTIIVTPDINVTGDPNDLPTNSFDIEISPFAIYLGPGEYKSTDWVIEDINGKVVWKYLNDTSGNTKITIPENTLLPDTIYIIKVRYRSTTNVYSNWGKKYVKTTKPSILTEYIPVNDVIRMLVSTVIYYSLDVEEDDIIPV